ncbi:Alpha-L-arabinofuranosidase C [Colletotrichum orbiculare MAFF 240422]|uniref:Alpha-L-arabinofuranosidase n=1 Tax=Colletotrichum orbiculare (strain 104-T / ATCC 96160 / CBS 514.97 / LARS 414 / MAFF 240422) TaxID=1213857 RepID=A0A484G8S8_COLOR|nr:Alpha-L-arabinofuranosidase C [Colletotrichum orbiculare MAFF 240422]
MKSFLLLVLLVTSVATASLPASFKWSSSGAIVGAKDDGRGIAGIKDPSIVKIDGKYHVFASTAQASGYNLVYLSFTDFNSAKAATFHYLDQTPIGTGYRAVPQKWSAPKDFFSGTPSIIKENIGTGYWVDMLVICDAENCHLFSSDDNGHLYRSQTTLANFPSGFNNTVIALSDTDKDNLYEASNVYRVEGGDYVLLVEAIGTDNARYFRSWTATSLSGPWTPLAATESDPFAGSRNVAFSGAAWTKSISHGEVVRENTDQRLTINPCKLQYLYQGAGKPFLSQSPLEGGTVSRGGEDLVLLPYQLPIVVVSHVERELGSKLLCGFDMLRQCFDAPSSPFAQVVNVLATSRSEPQGNTIWHRRIL